MKTLFLIITIIFSGFILKSQSWELKKSTDGISVYTRKTDESGICEFKATTKIDAEVDEIYKIVTDASNYNTWVDQISYSKFVSKGTNIFTVYYQIKLPVGFKNRDIVIENKVVTNTADKIKIELKSTPTAYPEQKSYTRITDAYGYWLIQKSGNQTEVTYQFYSDPKGIFPAWLINSFIVDGPFKSLKNLKQKF